MIELRSLTKGRTMVIRAILDALDALEHAEKKTPEIHHELVRDAKEIFHAAMQQAVGRRVVATAVAAACLAYMAAEEMYRKDEKLEGVEA